MRVTLRLCLLIGIALLVVACGTVAEPRPTFEPTTASHPRLSLDEEGDETVAEVEDEEVASAGAVGVEATAEAHEHTAAPTEAPEEQQHAEATEAAIATEAHTDDHEHTEATETAVATEEHTDDHEHAEATEAATEEAVAEVTSVTVEINGREYVGEAAYGETVFRTFPNPDPGPLNQELCVKCHNPDEPIPGIGPYLYGIVAREGSGHAEHDHGEGDALIDYLYTSIVEPDAAKAPAQVNPAGVEVDWNLDTMPENWGTVLSPQQIADLIAYLMTLDQVVESD